MENIFVSYRRTNVAVVRQMIKDLRSVGIDP
jgi:hypothetical protein